MPYFSKKSLEWIFAFSLLFSAKPYKLSSHPRLQLWLSFFLLFPNMFLLLGLAAQNILKLASFAFKYTLQKLDCSVSSTVVILPTTQPTKPKLCK